MIFKFLYNILKLNDIDDKTIENYCTSLKNESGINSIDLQEELSDVYYVYQML